MTLVEFKKLAAVSEYNTNNAWGFGGESGKMYTYKNIVFRDGKRSTRHSGTYPSLKMKIGDVYYKTRTSFSEALSKIKA